MGFPGGELSFPELCENGCFCATADEAQTWYEEYVGNNPLIPTAGVNGLLQPSRSDEGQVAGSNASDTGTFAQGSIEGTSQYKDQEGLQSKCEEDCTLAAYCDKSAGESNICTCQAQSSQYQVGSSAAAFVGACIMETEGKGG